MAALSRGALGRLERVAAGSLPPLRRLLAERAALAAELARLRDTLPAPVPAAAGRTGGSLSGLVDPARYEDPPWRALHEDLARYALDRHCFRNLSGAIHRKGYEWTHCLFGLRELGMLRPAARALGVGAGREPVIFWLAAHIAEVVATDRYGDAAWSSGGGREADRAALAAARRACPPGLDQARIRFEDADGTALPYPDASFDFAWSLSSIEHFGGHGAAAKALSEMARVVRPGGVVAVATEVLLLEEYRHPEYFTRAEIAALLAACPALALVSPIDYDCLPVAYLVDQIVVPAGVDRRRRHVVLNDGAVQWSSLVLFLRRRD